MNIPTYTQPIPYLTTEQMIEVDRAMIEDYGIELIQMMEIAGRNLAQLVQTRFFNLNPAGKTVVVLAGSGGNGGGAMVCARRLHNWGAQVRVILTRPNDQFQGIPARQLEILNRMAIPVSSVLDIVGLETPDLIIDGVIGYSLQGAPHGSAADLIEWANHRDAPVLALDIPSGIDAATGAIHEPAISATATMTLALPKMGLQAPGAAPYIGELYLADISVPPQLYADPALAVHVPSIFAESEIVRLK